MARLTNVQQRIAELLARTERKLAKVSPPQAKLLKPLRDDVIAQTSEEIKSIRKTLRLSQSGLAKKLKMSVATLQNWEQGRTVPNAHSLMLLRMAKINPSLFNAVVNSTSG
ncbi:helix-turn-helix domain-containing protein [Lonepinella sp. BR2474]|uniref:helix-turn-helix domain-containing protein n=1 Tax=Lonepinella sp. BR2474 TaxID=3434548 RepID=UPI003F6E2071